MFFFFLTIRNPLLLTLIFRSYRHFCLSGHCEQWKRNISVLSAGVIWRVETSISPPSLSLAKNYQTCFTFVFSYCARHTQSTFKDALGLIPNNWRSSESIVKVESALQIKHSSLNLSYQHGNDTLHACVPLCLNASVSPSLFICAHCCVSVWWRDRPLHSERFSSH